MSQRSVSIQYSWQISNRQRQVLELLASGETTLGIASIIHRSPKTVEYHRKKLMDKCGLNSIAELTQLALRLGLIDISV